MDRRTFVGAVAGAFLTAPLAAKAQQAGKVFRIGYLSAPTRESVEGILEAFLRALRQLGWIEGQNVVIEYRWAEGDLERLPCLAEDLVRRNVDVIVAPAASAALAAKHATSTIPIVMIFPNDPVGQGLVSNLRRPGGNVTGTTNIPISDMLGKRLQILKEAVPNATRVAIVYDPTDQVFLPPTKKSLEAAARSLGIQLQYVEVRGAEDFDGAFAAMERQRADALLVAGGTTFLINRSRFNELALKRRLPTMFAVREGVDAGGLVSYGVNMTDFVGRSAAYVDKILKGTKSADLAIEQPTKFELVINMKTAKSLGLRIPQSVLAARGRGDPMIDRRTFIGAFAGGLAIARSAAAAQQAAKVARIGFLGTNRAVATRHVDAFLQGLRDLGYVEGRNLVIEYRDAEGKLERLPALAAELVALKVDVIVAATTPGALAAKQATKTVPIVFAVAADPVTDGLVASLARPGGNVTGSSYLGPDLIGKLLELLKQAVPGVGRVAVLRQPSAVPERTEKEIVQEADIAARALGLQIQFVEARGPDDFDRAFSDMTRARAGALMVLGGNMFFSERRRLVDLAARNRLPGVYGLREYVDAGGLMSYGANQVDLFRSAATYVDKILKGAKPGDLPVEQPSKFELVINLKTAKDLGLTIPPSVLQRAEIIQ